MNTTTRLSILLAAIGCLFVTSPARAQTTPVVPPLVNQTITINGSKFLLTETNGIYTATAVDSAGNQYTISTPTSSADALAQIQTLVSENNTTNASFYSTNEIELRLGGVYEQNSGQAAAVISVIKWGWFPSTPLGFEASLLQGNQNGTSGTAGAYGAVDYRWIIGDTAAYGGVGGGYDNYNKRPFALVKAGVEHRFSKNIGVWVDLNYALESGGTSASRGFGFASGVNYAFSSFTTFH